MGDRRPSLIDQMAMAAALAGLEMGSSDDEDDEEEEDDDDESSLENDESGELRSTLPSSGGADAPGGTSRGLNRLRNSFRHRNDAGETNRHRSVADINNSSSIVIGQNGSRNELILDDDIDEEVYSDQIVDIVFHHDLDEEEPYGGSRQSNHRSLNNVYGYRDDDDDDGGDDDNNDTSMSDEHDRAIRRGERSQYGDVGRTMTAIGGGDFDHDDVDSEGLDQFDDDQLINQFATENYGWHSPRQQPPSSSSEEGVVISGLSMLGNLDNSTTGDWYNNQGGATGGGPSDPILVTTVNLAPSTPAPGSGPVDPNRRPSFKQRTSYTSSSSDLSYHSAPNPSGPATSLLYEEDLQARRSHSIAVPNAEGAGKARRNSDRSSMRRPSVKIKSFGGGALPGSVHSGTLGSTTTGSGDLTEDGMPTTPTGSVSSSPSVSLLSFRSRRSRQTRQTMSIQARSSPLGSLDHAIESLRKQDLNSEWENVAAAVTVVAAGEQGGSASKSRHIKFAVNDTVLVFLTLLNVTNIEGPKDSFTVAPVNKYGYPSGEGRTDTEKSGPYTFVLCTVKHVHFDEDDRYYTVERMDTGTEQRADSGWMEPLTDPYAIEAASRAAKKTVRSTQDKAEEVLEETGVFHECMDMFVGVLSWPHHFFVSTLFPFYKRLRSALKRMVTLSLNGDAPFSCKLRVTGINLLVSCSMAFLFLEVINVAFLPADMDSEMAIIGTVVWCILVIELILEVMIRPENYFQLVESDKAFAPSTARYINRFHLVFEALALLTYIPEFQCTVERSCTRGEHLNLVVEALAAVRGETHRDSARGRFTLGVMSLRFFGVIRHWKQMWINNTFQSTKREGIEKWLCSRESHQIDSLRAEPVSKARRLLQRTRKRFDDETLDDDLGGGMEGNKMTSSEEDQRLKNAATIGTALMVVNSQRALILMVLVVLVLPLLSAIIGQNLIALEFTQLLEDNNLASITGDNDTDCDYLELAIESWLTMAIIPQPSYNRPDVESTFVLWAQVLPVRCPFQDENGVITSCDGRLSTLQESYPSTCQIWGELAPSSPEYATDAYFATTLNLRPGGINTFLGGSEGQIRELNGVNVTVIYNENVTVSLANQGLFYLLLMVLILGLYFLQALRGDAIRLVLDPLQRMLKIVLRYAENPLSQDVKSNAPSRNGDGTLVDNDGEEIGNFETEQLINAITKIADLLRKCWGVAGAGIISSNLARTKDGKTVVFNPTVPGKRVYALFGFVAINGFSELLRALDRDVMILINDVAKVVHDEVYRWALGEHGQCNKNLGPAFLMVWRIGDFSEVHKKKQVATEKLFRDNPKGTKNRSNLRHRRHLTPGRVPYTGRRPKAHPDASIREIQLESLPGIQAFTDRALLGMLKSFAGIHRDNNLNVWKNDFRLSAGVSAYRVDIIYGMDAGWAVEGAVGSEYKIDATYLSPHVNMASRMMSAAKQYGVTILLSKAVEKLLSKNCRKKLRHLDTVYVKGSNIKQDIFTYDARVLGVDFFLLERTPEQADVDSEAYSPNIWDQDQDLRAMRQHVSDSFMETYSLAMKLYLGGNWVEAYKNFERADIIMIERVLEDGFLEIDADDLEGRIFDMKDQSDDIVRIRQELGDGACRSLMHYMERRNLKAPADWDAVRQLYSK